MMWQRIDLDDRSTWPPYTADWVEHAWRDGDGQAWPAITQGRRLATALEYYAENERPAERQDWSWRMMAWPWEDDGRRSTADGHHRFTETHVATMAEVVRLWPYPGVAARTTLREIAELMAGSVNGEQEEVGLVALLAQCSEEVRLLAQEEHDD